MTLDLRRLVRMGGIEKKTIQGGEGQVCEDTSYSGKEECGKCVGKGDVPVMFNLATEDDVCVVEQECQWDAGGLCERVEVEKTPSAQKILTNKCHFLSWQLRIGDNNYNSFFLRGQ